MSEIVVTIDDTKVQVIRGVDALRCEVTGNLCGTDTWGAMPCSCVNCQNWMLDNG